jgi:hypothetical protein
MSWRTLWVNGAVGKECLDPWKAMELVLQPVSTKHVFVKGKHEADASLEIKGHAIKVKKALFCSTE